MRYLLILLILLTGCMPASKKSVQDTRVTLHKNSEVDKEQAELIEGLAKFNEQLVEVLRPMVPPEQYVTLLKNCSYINASANDSTKKATSVEALAKKQTEEDVGLVSKSLLSSLLSLTTVIAKATGLPMGTTESITALVLLAGKWLLDKKKRSDELLEKSEERHQIYSELSPEEAAAARAYDKKKAEIRAKKGKK